MRLLCLLSPCGFRVRCADLIRLVQSQALYEVGNAEEMEI